MTRTLRALTALCLASLALIASGCGSGSGSAGDPASVVPDSSFLYAEATIDPQGSQEEAVRSILADLPGTGAPQDRLEDLIRDAVRKDKSTKVDWDKDIKPWLGDRVGAFVAGNAASFAQGDIPGAFLVATTDDGAARAALEKDKDPGAAHKRYRDVQYIVETDHGDVTAEGVVDGFLVSGSDAGMRAVIDASKGSTLADSDRFKKAVDEVPDEHVGFAYVGAFLGRLLAGRPLVITARAENQALIFEGRSIPTGGLVKSSGDPASLLEKLPASSWAALALPGFGDGIRAGVAAVAGALGGQQGLAEQLRAATGLDLERDLLSWIGDVGIFVDGDSKDTVGGGLLVKSKDPAASKQALTKIAAAVAKNDPTTRVAAARVPGAFGYQLQPKDEPRPIFMVQRADEVALTYGESEARAALSGGGLSGSPDFKRAAEGLGEGYATAFYLAAPPVLRLAESLGASGKDYEAAKPYLTILDYLVAGSAGDGDQKSARLRIGFKPHE
jgi:hypothetical protein